MCKRNEALHFTEKFTSCALIGEVREIILQFSPQKVFQFETAYFPGDI